MVNRGIEWGDRSFEYFCALHVRNMLLYVQHGYANGNSYSNVNVSIPILSLVRLWPFLGKENFDEHRKNY